MNDLVQELTEMADKYRRNLEKTTEEERKGKYKKQFNSYQQKMKKKAVELIDKELKAYVHILPEDVDSPAGEEYMDKVLAVINGSDSDGVILGVKTAYTVFVKTLDLTAFGLCLAMLGARIEYVAMRKYFLDKMICSEEGFKNPVIDQYMGDKMIWVARNAKGQYGGWYNQDKTCCTTALPPVDASMQVAYKELREIYLNELLTILKRIDVQPTKELAALMTDSKKSA